MLLEGRTSQYWYTVPRSTALSGLQVSITFKNQQVLKDVSWDVKKGEKVGLVGVNGAGKTTQLQIITGALQADSGNVIKAKDNMRIAYLTQEFDVTPSNTVREEFMSAFGEQVHFCQLLYASTLHQAAPTYACSFSFVLNTSSSCQITVHFCPVLYASTLHKAAPTSACHFGFTENI